MLSPAGSSGSYKTKYSSRRPFAPKTLMSSRGQIDYLELGHAGLHSVQGAQEIISMISSRPTVTKLILTQNALRDDGCIMLFKFLCSDLGRTKRISEIRLAKNGLEDRGLLAISEYIKRNETLTELFLSANAFQNSPPVILPFTAALNTSHLERLSLSSNRQLSDRFVATFLPHLDSLHLRDLSLSLVGLTPLSVPDIISYVSSPRCRLHSFSLNGNSLGLQGVTDIIKAVEENNFGLGKLELYSNQNGELGLEDIEASREIEQILKRTLIRNQYLKRQTEKEALTLLVFARASLLRPKSKQDAHTASSTSTSHPSLPPIPSLPTELQLYTLSFLAPTLSSAQRIRIYKYASTFGTLPALLPRLTSNGGTRGVVCRPDPTPLIGLDKYKNTACSDGCIKGIVCQKEEERRRWLKLVGCDSYEREVRGDLR
ncbi:hypothetical protein PILCRDRAFT_815947 [Piloderma croceum F 1598]|uniref:RNI-like protein n=1 Tax=Piloderma croceum (strain F 1598) TaxID=765440 RepID=A0A0C3CAI7_PILCF|nr:hypothetical protein PILCRDRAFT_815947 [Piloderma croceum F 1598]